MESTTQFQPDEPRAPVDWTGTALTTLVGAMGGAGGALLAKTSPGSEALIGGIFGLVGATALRGRASSPGAGLIWGLGGAFLLWIALPAFGSLFHLAAFSRDFLMTDARSSFPGLVLRILCIGAPVGISLGVRGRPAKSAGERFHWGRAISAGGMAGIVAALIFSRWMYEGDFFPLISGFGNLSTHFRTVVLHFAVACLIGCTFGGLFQAEVRNLGSSMGWGMAYAMFWWFLGPLTLFPFAAGERPNWSAENASQLFGPLVGYILYGLILGVVYAAVNAVWTRLFIESDPLNRKREGPGVRLLRSFGWGSAAGISGGMVALPLMIKGGVITKLAGIDAGLHLAVGICLHLAVSTLIGAAYGMLFRGETRNEVEGSLWGFMVGMIAWYAGPLTLLPLIRAGEIDWRPEAAAVLLPSLVGHLLFGMITANVFLAFEWRSSRPTLLANHPTMRLDGTTERAASPAAPLCVFALGLGVLLPVLLS